MEGADHTPPMADAGNDAAFRAKCQAVIARRNLARASNDTRWNALITHMRQREGWQPSYRSKSIFGDISGWDVEWFAHLPFPFASVEWFDIGLHELLPRKGMLLPEEVADHTGDITSVLRTIGFEFEVAGDVVRIWGYWPKCRDDFPPQS
jgi:hypothetical protein